MNPESHPFHIVEKTEEMAIFHHKALLIIVNKSAKKWPIYDATRYAWKIDVKRAIEADVILAIIQGLIVDAFVAEAWLEATEVNFPSRAEKGGRTGSLWLCRERGSCTHEKSLRWKESARRIS